MNRRDFLAGIAATSVAGLVSLVLPTALQAIKAQKDPPIQVRATALGKTFLGTRNGQILSKAKEGDWQLSADFGETCPILDLSARRDELFARVGFLDHSFLLRSSDGQVWYTGETDV